MDSLTHLEYDCDIFVVTTAAILEKNSLSENKESCFVLKCCYFRKNIEIQKHELPDALSKEFFFKCLLVISYEQFIVPIVELIMLSWQQILSYSFRNMSHLAFLSFPQVRSSYLTWLRKHLNL